MLHVKVDLVPFGLERNRETLSDIYIGNDGTGNRDFGNYDVYLDWDPRETPQMRDDRSQRPGWVGRIERHPRGRHHRLLIVSKAIEVALAAEGAEAA